MQGIADLLDRQAVVDVVTTLFIETDERRWSSVRACFAASVHFDMTSLAGGEPATLTPEAITGAWDAGLDGSRTRSEFSSTMLGRDLAAVKSYWQKMIFSGRATAPIELATEAEVLEFVRKFPAAIGYVSEGATVPAGVKVVKID